MTHVIKTLTVAGANFGGALLRDEILGDGFLLLKAATLALVRITNGSRAPRKFNLARMPPGRGTLIADVSSATSFRPHVADNYAVPHIPLEMQMETQNSANNAPGAVDAITLLKADHRAVEKLFDAFEKAKDGDLDAKGALARRACEELTVHAMIEEEFLYPAAHRALEKQDKIDVDEAYVEHYVVKTLIEKFDSLRPGDVGFDATFKVMSELVKHHVEEEESELFPELRESGVDLMAMGAKLSARKNELMKKLDAAGGKLVGDRSLSFTRAA